MSEEKAPPFENWNEHLRSLGDRELADLARDYRWLDEKAHAQPREDDFHRRRQAIIAECERRGLTSVARECTPA